MYLCKFNAIVFVSAKTTQSTGKMAERSNAAVLKTVDLRGSGGSNPSLSANETLENSTPNYLAAFLFELLSQFLSQKWTKQFPTTLQRNNTVCTFLSAYCVILQSETKQIYNLHIRNQLFEREKI